ncbi:MAG: CDP-diacylglycerol--serine O-phosphatidyltransferase [Nitrospirae bacterium]|nr:CDP-diacylglycerol--serine O-phosphatidyltransferase [Nitrospirota bacterium]
MKEESNKRNGVYIIPSLLTAANLFCGFYAIVSVLNSDLNTAYVTAAIAILVAMLFDGFDGKIARLTNSTSRFGVEFDSLSDLVSFGVAPGLLVYRWGLHDYGKIGWLAVFLFVVCGAMRLARFNVQAAVSDKKFFTGLPIPAAAGLIATTVIFDIHILEMGKEVRPLVVLIITYLLAYLMVSTIKFRSFKDVHLVDRKPLSALVAAVLILIVIVAKPQLMLFVLFVLYASSGPVERLIVPVNRLFKRKAHEPGVNKG